MKQGQKFKLAILNALVVESHMTRVALFSSTKDAFGADGWSTFKRTLGELLSDKKVERITPKFADCLHDAFVLTSDGKLALEVFDVIDMTMGELLMEDVSRATAIKYAVKWTGENNYTRINISDASNEVIVEK